jgi:hypothetical protein
MSGKVKAQIEKRDKRWGRLDSIISRKYATSFMNNAKWVKLLEIASEFFPDVKNIEYKLVYTDEVKVTSIEEHKELIDENWFIEPTIYKEIEWLEFPYIKNQKIDEFAIAINQRGEFQLVQTQTGLRILGYGLA